MRMAEILHRLGYISRNHAVAVTRTISSGSTSGTPRRRPRRCSSAPSSALLGTRNRGRNPLSLDPEHREFEAKKEFGAECRDRRNQRRNKALLIWRTVCQVSSVHAPLVAAVEGLVEGCSGGEASGEVLDVGQSHMRGLATPGPWLRRWLARV